MSIDPKASFIRSLCIGAIKEEILFPYPKMEEEERETVSSVIDSFNSWLNDKTEDFRAWDVKGELPEAVLNEMKEMGLFGLIIPEDFGGMGFSTSAYSRSMQALVYHDGSLAITAGAHSSIGMKGLLMFGTEEQKKKYLPKLSTGEMIAAYCLTEPGAGSDAASIKTKAVKEGDHWVLSGEKLWITNGGIADFFTVFASTDTEEGKITAFIVTKDLEGITIGPHEDKMGLRASSTTTVHFDKVRVPQENVLGEVGKGFKVAVKILNNGRTGLGGGCIGGMKKCIDMAIKQASERKQFGQPISDFGLIKKKIGQMTVDCYTSESVVNLVSGLIDQGYEDYAVEAAISKVYATDALWRTVDEALQVSGGNGYMREFPYERILRDSRVNRIFEGTNDILHLFIGLTAMKDAADQLKELAKTIGKPGKVFGDPIKGFGVFADYAKKTIASATGVGSSRFTKAPPALRTQCVLFEGLVRRLSGAVDRIIRKHGKRIIGKQLATQRLAAIIIDLFVFSCTISRVSQSIEEKGEEGAKREIDILDIFAFQANDRILNTLRKIDENVDELLKSTSEFMVEEQRYSWDNI
ncbi:acyl-CoA dehydrogenase [bacterium]|nr:acyl-CoA dehydrogenase [bacterium]